MSGDYYKMNARSTDPQERPILHIIRESTWNRATGAQDQWNIELRLSDKDPIVIKPKTTKHAAHLLLVQLRDELVKSVAYLDGTDG